MRSTLFALWFFFAPAGLHATVAEVPKLDLDVSPGRGASGASRLGGAGSLGGSLSGGGLTAPTLTPSLKLAAPAPELAAMAAPTLSLESPGGAASARALSAAPQAAAPLRSAAPAPAPSAKSFDVVLDLDATIIGKIPEGDSAKGLPLKDAESITVTYTTFKGEQNTSTYLIRKGFKDFIRRSRQDPNVRGIHLLSGSNQLRLNSVAAAIEIDGKPLSELVDTMIGGEFLLAYSPLDSPDAARRPLKDLNVYDLKELPAISAALRKGDIEGALALPRQAATPKGGFLKDNRFLVIDDSPEMVRGGALTQVQGLIPFKAAAKVIGAEVEDKTRKRMIDMRGALWDHQNSEFGRLSEMLQSGLVPGSPEWQAQEKTDFERRWRAAGKD